MTKKWPEPDDSLIDKESVIQFEILKTLITAIRTFRAEHAIDPKQLLSIALSSKDTLDDYALGLISQLAHAMIVDTLSVKPQIHETGFDITIEMPHDPTLDSKHDKEQDALTKYISSLEHKLGDFTFTSKAPAAVVEKKRAKLEEAKLKLSKLT